VQCLYESLAAHRVTDPFGEVDHVLVPDVGRDGLHRDEVQLIELHRVLPVDAEVARPETELSYCRVDEPTVVVVLLILESHRQLLEIHRAQVEHGKRLGLQTHHRAHHCSRIGASRRTSSSIRPALAVQQRPALPLMAEAKAMDKLLLKIPEVAASLGISRAKVYELLADDTLPSVKIGGCRRVRANDLIGYVNGLASLTSSG
jgi:excisionase family DNA binding protein